MLLFHGPLKGHNTQADIQYVCGINISWDGVVNKKKLSEKTPQRDDSAFRKLEKICSNKMAYVTLDFEPSIYFVIKSVSRCCCSFAKFCLTLGDPMDCGTLGSPVLQNLLEFTQTHVH